VRRWRRRRRAASAIWAVGVIAGVAAGVVGLLERPAEACTGAWPSVGRGLVVPEDGSQGVPTNARIYVSYWVSMTQIAPDVELHGPVGDVIAATVSRTGARDRLVLVITPDAPLVPRTTYTIHDNVVSPCDPQVDSCEGPLTPIASFTTGDGPDVRAPAVTGVSVQTRYEDPGPDSSCDWDGPSVTHVIAVDEVTDDRPVGWVRFLYYDGHDNLRAGPLPLVTLGRDCGDTPPYYQPYDLLLEEAVFSIRAVDLAGNVEPVAHRLAGEPCAAFVPRGGCTASGGGATVAPPIVTALALLRRRRRRGAAVS
jgi:uncharacterized protein (TIGR03382 family)